MRKYLMLAMVALGFLLALTACGGSGPSTNLRVDMVEFMFEPSDYSIPAGQEITLELSNNGAVVHEFIIMKYGTEVGQDFGPEDEENIYWEVELDPGTSNTFTFTAPTEPGEYQVVCGTAGHYLAGMVAKLIVVAE
jgi:uncharacterized cupredoxin-like copper-binding protein